LFGSGFAHAVGLAVGDHDVGVVQEAVEHADGGGVFGQEPAPGLEGPVAGDAEGAAFVDAGDEPEQQLCAGVVEWAKPISSQMISWWRRRVSITRLTLLSARPR